jgi:hypothetical protein
MPSLEGNGPYVYAQVELGFDSVLYRIDGDTATEIRRDLINPITQPIYSVLENGNVMWLTSRTIADEIAPDGSIVATGVEPIFERHALEGGEATFTTTVSVTSAAGTTDEQLTGAFAGVFPGGSVDDFDFAVIEIRMVDAVSQNAICLRHFNGTASVELRCTDPHNFDDYVIQGSSVVYAAYENISMVVRELPLH